jgi:hypothetical protein
MWNEYLALMVMAVLLRTSYELSKSKEGNPDPYLAPNVIGLTDRQKEWAEKAIKKYAEAQEQKWRHWNEAMFEAMK